MCGIIGAAGNLDRNSMNMIEFMLLVDQTRGKHSTGVAFIKKDERSFIKKAVHSTDFLDMGVVEKAFKELTYKAIIGHNRYATVGSVTAENAHPFEHGPILGVHNGTLRSRYTLPNWQQFDVDSDNLYHSIDQIGARNTIKKLDGAFTLVWHDNTDNTVNLVRNDERPLHYAFSTDNKTIFWASEPWMLLVGAQKCHVKIQEVKSLTVGTLMTIELADLKFNEEIVDRCFEEKVEIMEKRQAAGGATAGTSGRTITTYGKTNPKVTARSTPIYRDKSKGGTGNVIPFKSAGPLKVNDKTTFIVDHVLKLQGDRISYFGYDMYGNDIEVNSYSHNTRLDMDKIYTGEILKATPIGTAQTLIIGSTTTQLVKDMTRDDLDDAITAYEDKLRRQVKDVIDETSDTSEDDSTDDVDVSFIESDSEVRDHEWFGDKITRDEFVQKVNLGCAWCTDVTMEDDEVIPISKDEFVCAECASLPVVKQFIQEV